MSMMKINACYEVEYKNKSVRIWDLVSNVSDTAGVDEEVDKMFSAKLHLKDSDSESIDRTWLLSVDVDGVATYTID